jgi:hypothetical protein
MADVHLSRREIVDWRDAGAGDRDRIVPHLATCATCRHLAAELERDRPPGSASPERLRPEDFIAVGRRAAGTPARAFDMPRAAVYLAAAASLVLTVVVLGPRLRESYDPTPRGNESAVVPVSPKDAAVSAASVAFAWDASAAAGTLRLVVTTVDGSGRPVVDRPVTGTHYELTADERQRFERGREYYWFVEYGGAGIGAGTSAAARFRVE